MYHDPVWAADPLWQAARMTKLVHNGLECVNVPQSRPRGVKHHLLNKTTWTGYKYTNHYILHLTHSSQICNFCLVQPLKYIAHITRLPNLALQKQIIFRSDTLISHKLVTSGNTMINLLDSLQPNYKRKYKTCHPLKQWKGKIDYEYNN